MADDVRDIEKLIHTYAERIDAGDLAGVAVLFANGRILAAPGVVFEGAEEVRKMYENSVRIHDDGTPRTRHVTTNMVVDVDEGGNTAVSRAYYTVFQQTEDLPLQVIISGHYHDTFHRVDGRWCFEAREMFVDLTGDLSHHLRFEL